MRAPVVSVCLAGALAGCAPEPRPVDVPVTTEAKLSESPESAFAPDGNAAAPAGTSAIAARDAAADWDDDAQAVYGKEDALGGIVLGGRGTGPMGLAGSGVFSMDGGWVLGGTLGPATAQVTPPVTPPVILPGGDGGGPLGPEQIRRVVMAHVGALRACYEIEAQRNPGLSGKVSLAWTIEPAGAVSKASVASTTMHDERVEKCLVRQVQSWRFPTSGSATTVSFPVVFGVAGDGGA